MTEQTILPGLDGGAQGTSYTRAFAETESRVERALLAAPPVVRRYTGHLAASRGKFIRAAALLACSMDEAGAVPPQGPCLAAAVELLHLATLVHDDVIDDADTRRGEPTLQKKYGRRAAVICGDYLLAQALRMAQAGYREDQKRPAMPDYAARICKGELEQLINNDNLSLSTTRYLRIIGGKTAALFEASFYGGACLAPQEERRLAQYRRLGRWVGMIFQVMDDCNDFLQESAAAGKPVRSDYEQGVVTLPLIWAIGQQPSLRQQAQGRRMERRELDKAVLQTGGLDYARQVAGRYRRKAERLLAAMELPREKRERLEQLLLRACGEKGGAV